MERDFFLLVINYSGNANLWSINLDPENSWWARRFFSFSGCSCVSVCICLSLSVSVFLKSKGLLTRKTLIRRVLGAFPSARSSGSWRQSFFFFFNTSLSCLPPSLHPSRKCPSVVRVRISFKLGRIFTRKITRFFRLRYNFNEYSTWLMILLWAECKLNDKRWKIVNSCVMEGIKRK